MKVVLQNCKTKLFLREPGHWTEDIEAARQFDRCLDALAFITANRLTDMQVVLVFSSRAYDVVMPVSDGCSSAG